MLVLLNLLLASICDVFILFPLFLAIAAGLTRRSPIR